MRKYKSKSTVSPPEWDTTSSPTTKYHNTNVVVVPAINNTPTMYEYDVTEYTKQECESLQLTKVRSDLDYIAIVAGVNLDE